MSRYWHHHLANGDFNHASGIGRFILNFSKDRLHLPRTRMAPGGGIGFLIPRKLLLLARIPFDQIIELLLTQVRAALQRIMGTVEPD